ncbi:MAG: TetR/AcrR family transcriptional regulator [Bacteroidetes bacterium]|nr:TetR/AcrR family transcriptional regulator [Bacteroidota bacterium]
MVNTPHCTEEKILEAAKKIFHRKGYDGTRMQEIADEAGINKALLHYYFRTKENLFNAVFQDAFKDIFSRLFLTVGSDDPLEEKLGKMINEYIGFLQKNSFIPGFILSEINQNPDKIIDVFHSVPVQPLFLYEKLRDSMRDARIENVDPRDLFINVLSMCIFPVVAKPLLKVIFNFSEKEYDEFIEKRKKELPEFIMNAITKK